MKKIFITLAVIIATTIGASAQKFALVDMEYVLSNLPAYEMANEQLDQMSKRWQKEVEALSTEAEEMYKNYQGLMVFMNQEQKKEHEEAIVAKEKEAMDLRNKYFGPEGELYKKRIKLMQPIQEDVYNAVKAVAEQRGYQCIFDRASSSDIIFASPRIDISNEVLERLGYSK